MKFQNSGNSVRIVMIVYYLKHYMNSINIWVNKIVTEMLKTTKRIDLKNMKINMKSNQ